MVVMAARLPLPTLLSHVLVAFTIEFDNEAEHRMAHRTTNGPRVPIGLNAPWLASQVMWANVMQFVGADGVRLSELHARARTTRDSLAGLQRWGYVAVEVDPADIRPVSSARDPMILPTAAGRHAQDVWRPLAGTIEGRWRERFGADVIAALRGSLQAVIGQLDLDLPFYLPVVYPTMNGKAEVPSANRPLTAGDTDDMSSLDLSALLSQALLSFTIDFERASLLSLPISANSLRVLTEGGVRVRDLPQLTGVSKEANAMSVGFLARHGCALVEPDPTARPGKVVRLTPKGLKAQKKYHRLLGVTEKAWEDRFGEDGIATLRASLDRLVSDTTADASPLQIGLEPYPDGWRASRRQPDQLPHYPMILHRGGFPDGS
jgi:DNA-binding MarR family transcriptional regulator